MRRTSIFCVVTAMAAAGTASAQTAAGGGAANLPRVSITTTVFDANGRSPATASRAHTEDFTQYAYAGKTICQIGGSAFAQRIEATAAAKDWLFAGRGAASNAAAPDSSVMPTDAGFGWRVDGKVVSASANEVVVQLEWQRMWDRGKTVNGPRGSTQLALHPGERVPLDSIAAVALPGECSGVTLTLQAAFSPYAMSVGGARGGGVGRGGIGNVQTGAAGGVGGGVATVGAGGRGAGGGGGVGVGTGGGMGAVAVGGGRGVGVAGGGGGGRGRGMVATGGVAGGGASSGPGGTVVVTSGFDPQTLHLVDAELWLVHKKPDGSEVAQQRTVRTVPGTGEFTFDTVPVSTPDGNYVVTVTGSVQAQRLLDGTEKLFVGIIRRIAVAGEGGYFSSGGTGRTVAMPKSGEVISFEMPDTAIRPDFNPFRSHEFSVRVRVNR